MASSLSLHQHTIYCLSPTPTLRFGKYPHHISILPSFRKNFLKFDSPTTVPFAVTESDSPKSLEPDPQTLLQQVAVRFKIHLIYYYLVTGFPLNRQCYANLWSIIIIPGEFCSTCRLFFTASSWSSLRCKFFLELGTILQNSMEMVIKSVSWWFIIFMHAG